jgi:hypothetical protein
LTWKTSSGDRANWQAALGLSGTLSSLRNGPHRDRQRWGHTSGKIHGGPFQCPVALCLLETPLVPPPVRNDQPSDRAAAKVAALIAIFVLGLAIRDRSSASGLLGSSTISAAAAVVAGVVDRLSNRASARLHDGVVISAYASTIVTMLIYLVCETVLVQTLVWYQKYRFGWEILAPVCSRVSSPILRWSSFRLPGTVPGSAGGR